MLAASISTSPLAGLCSSSVPATRSPAVFDDVLLNVAAESWTAPTASVRVARAASSQTSRRRDDPSCGRSVRSRTARHEDVAVQVYVLTAFEPWKALSPPVFESGDPVSGKVTVNL